jgi:hypothetical protein
LLTEGFYESDIALGDNDKPTVWLKMLRYLEKHWWRHKELCVKYWTNKIRHFGHDTTSPGEGGHAVLKSWLQTSNHDVLTMIERMAPYYDSHIDR